MTDIYDDLGDEVYASEVIASLQKTIKTLKRELKKVEQDRTRWKKQAARAARATSECKAKYMGYGKQRSVRTVSGGAPGLGKNRRN